MNILSNIAAATQVAKNKVLDNPRIKSTEIYYVTDLTSADAKYLLDGADSTGQRKINKERVKLHKNNIKTNAWNCSEVSLSVLPNGSYRIADGQHRLTAIYLLGVAHDFTIPITLKVNYVVDTEAARKLFSDHDSPCSARTKNDIVTGYDIPGLTGFTKTWINRITGAVLHREAGYKKSSVSQRLVMDPEIMLAATQNNTDFLNHILRVVVKMKAKRSTELLLSRIFTHVKGLAILLEIYNAAPAEFVFFIDQLIDITDADEKNGTCNRVYTFIANERVFDEAVRYGDRFKLLAGLVWYLHDEIINSGKKVDNSKLTVEKINRISTTNAKFAAISVHAGIFNGPAK